MSVQVSIITACYNHGIYLDEMVQSVRASLADIAYEHIIVDDGSTDPFTKQKLGQLSEQGIIVLTQSNQGLGAARNTGIRKALGGLILPLDCDNKLCFGFVQRALPIFLQEPQVGVVYGDALLFGEKAGYSTVGSFNLQRLMLSNYIDACALFRRSAWERIGGFDENRSIMMWSDWDFWLRVAFSGARFYYLPMAAFEYRVLSHSMVHSADRTKYLEAAAFFYKKHEQYLGDVHLFTTLNALKVALAKFMPGLYRLFVRLGIIKNPFSLW
ncbi:MAG: glycosyltransferase [Sphingomonadales bacterium]